MNQTPKYFRLNFNNLLGSEVNMSPRNEYFCTTPKNGSAQECGSKGGPHGNISAQKSNISARIKKR